MKRIDSAGAAVRKVLAAVSKYGLRAGIADSLARWGQSRRKVPQDVMEDYGWVLNEERRAELRAPDSGPLRIQWLVPDFSEASGGMLNVLRTVYQLERWGHRNRISVVGKTTMNGARATEAARKHYFPIQSEVEIFRGEVEDSDALVATHWSTAYAARSLGNTAGKFYFVQDVEPMFYPAGGLCEVAKQSYRLGFQGITLGPWIAETLRGEFGMECRPFGFSYDREIYSPQGKKYYAEGRKRVLFYARPRTERRGFELGILALSLVAQRMPETEFVLVGFPAQSIQLPFRAVLPGILSPGELASLYRCSTLALVLSHTNLSMLPLELMACDCAVVSNTGANVEWLLTEANTQLAEPTPEAIARAIVELLENDGLRAKKVTAGRALAESTDWSAEIKKIESAFYLGLGVAMPGSPRRGAVGSAV